MNPWLLLPLASLLVLPIGWVEFQLLPRTRLGALLAPLAGGALYGPWLLAALHLGTLPPAPLPLAVGATLVLIALLLWAWASPPLVRIPGQMQVSPERLLTIGAYAWTRNPLYTGHALFLGGVPLCLGAPQVFLSAPLLWFIADQAARYEERRILAPSFGEAFHTYRARVPRLMPAWAWVGWGLLYVVIVALMELNTIQG